MSDYGNPTPAMPATGSDDETHAAVTMRVRTLGFGFWLSIVWIVGVVLAAILAPVLPLDDPEATGLGGLADRYNAPSADAWFGTDANGRDVFSRTIWASRVSLIVGAFAIFFGMIVGGTIGILSGYFRGITDMVSNFIMFTLLSFPALVLAILIVSVLERDVQYIALTLGILAVAPVGRLARATTIQYSEREFVQAARVVGAKHRRIIVRELLPNVVIPMGSLTLLGMAIAIIAEGNLAFLGLSDPDRLSWGGLIYDNAAPRAIQQGFHAAFIPILFMFFTVLALNFAGDRIRQYYDVRELAF